MALLRKVLSVHCILVTLTGFYKRISVLSVSLNPFTIFSSPCISDIYSFYYQFETLSITFLIFFTNLSLCYTWCLIIDNSANFPVMLKPRYCPFSYPLIYCKSPNLFQTEKHRLSEICITLRI